MSADSSIKAVLGRTVLPLIILSAVVLSYSDTFSSPFVLDDFGAIMPRSWRSSAWPPMPRMLTKLTFRINYAIGGPNVADYHLTNLLIHAMAALLLYGIVRRTLLLPGASARAGGAAQWIAGASALLWAVHPLNTQGVTYICQRHESLMAVFFLLALYSLVRMREGRHPRFWGDCAIAASAAGMATKEVMVVAPLALLLYDYVFIDSSIRRLLRSNWRFYAALFGTWGILGMLWVFSGIRLMEHEFVNVAPMEPSVYFVSQAGVIVHYLKLALFPAGLCFDYAWPAAKGVADVLPQGILLVVLLAATAWATFRRHPLGWVGACFFLVLGVTSSFLPIPDLAVEHRMYLPLACVIVSVVVACWWVGQRTAERFPASGRAVKTAGILAVAVAATALAVLTFERNKIYRSSESIWKDTIQKSPGNFRAHMALISGLMRNEQFKEAEKLSREVVDLTMGRGSAVGDQALWNNAAYRYKAENQLGRALLGLGQPVEAIRHFEEATRCSPESSSAWYNLGLAHFTAGNKDLATAALLVAIAAEPQYARAHALLGQAYAETGQFLKSARHYRVAVDLDRDLLYAKVGLAWLLATCPEEGVRDGRKAVELAEAVCVVTEKRSPAALDVLGAAYAETGRFADAVRIAELGLRLAGKQGDNIGTAIENDDVAQLGESGASAGTGRKDSIEQRLELYLKSQPYRQAAKNSLEQGKR